MSTGAKLAVLVVVLLAVMAGLNSYKAQAPVTTPDTTQSNALPADASSLAGADTSDAALDRDLASFDASVKATADASAAADQGLSDKPVAQGE